MRSVMDAVKDYEKAQQALEKVNGDIAVVEGEFIVARANLGNAIANERLGAAPGQAPDRKVCFKIQEKLDELTAARESLSARLADLRDNLCASQQEFESLRASAVQKHRSRWKAEYAKALASFREVLLKGVAIADAADLDSVFLRKSYAPDLDNFQNALDLSTQTVLTEGSITYREAWRKSKGATELHDELSAELNPIHSAQRLIAKLEKQTEVTV